MKVVDKMHLFSQNAPNLYCANLPCIANIVGNKVSILFSSRNADNISSIYNLSLELSKNKCIITNIGERPLLECGKLGAFDEFGVWASSVVKLNNLFRMYYIGWNRNLTTPFRLSIGVAESKNIDRGFHRLFEGPIMDRSIEDPYLVSSPYVLKIENKYYMWYTSGKSWKFDGSDYKLFYHIRLAKSNDGLRWNDRGHVCIDFQNSYEYALARPCVIKKNNMLHMWYSYRASTTSATYRIGYAISPDGLNWKRLDHEFCFDVSNSGWDSEMVCYPMVFEHDNTLWMLYNGNDFGRTGFGIARLED